MKSHLIVQALIRQAERLGAFAAVLHKGDGDAGSLLVLVEGPDRHSQPYSRLPGPEGRLFWQPLGPALAPPDLVDYLDRARRRDPDLWVIAIDDPKGTIVLDHQW